jgi:hypothetical protein
MVPGHHATLLLASGQTAQIEWAQIAQIERGQPAATPGPAAPAPPPAAPKKVAVVHIEGDGSLRLEAKEGRSWRFLCASPCDREVDLADTYRVSGDGVRPTRQFTIDAQPGQRVVLTVDTASKAGFVGGIVLVSVAPVVSIVGLVVLLVGDVANDTGTKTTGAALAIGGLAGIGLGIVLIAVNARSGLEQNVATRAALRDAEREPIWRDPAREAAGAPPPIVLTSPAIRF